MLRPVMLMSADRCGRQRWTTANRGATTEPTAGTCPTILYLLYIDFVKMICESICIKPEQIRRPIKYNIRNIWCENDTNISKVFFNNRSQAREHDWERLLNTWLLSSATDTRSTGQYVPFSKLNPLLVFYPGFMVNVSEIDEKGKKVRSLKRSKSAVIGPFVNESVF